MSEVMALDEDTVEPIGFRKLEPSFLTEQTPLPAPWTEENQGLATKTSLLCREIYSLFSLDRNCVENKIVRIVQKMLTVAMVKYNQ